MRFYEFSENGTYQGEAAEGEVDHPKSRWEVPGSIFRDQRDQENQVSALQGRSKTKNRLPKIDQLSQMDFKT